DVHVDGVAGLDVRALARLLVDAEHVGPAHRSDRAPIGEVVDCDPDERPLGGAEAVHHLGGDLDSGCRLAREQDLRSKSHAPSLAASSRAGMIDIQVQPTTSANHSARRLPWLSPLMT